jgi:hypothetical protein
VGPPAAARQSKPGIFAPGWEKVLYKAVTKDDKTAFARVAGSEPKGRHTALFLDAVAGPNAGNPERIRNAIEVLWQEGYDPASDQFLKKYVPSDMMELGIAEGVTATITADRDAIGLLLGEIRQALGDVSGAIDVVEQVTPSTVAAVSLAELYTAQGRWDDVVNLTNRVLNEDAFATFLLIQRGVALRELQHYDASREALKAALAPRSRPACPPPHGTHRTRTDLSRRGQESDGPEGLREGPR